MNESEIRHCPACGHRPARWLGHKKGFELLSCVDCGTLYTPCIPPPAGVQEYYDNYYGEFNLTLPDFVHRQLDSVVATFRDYRQNNRLLDVGFGAGGLMQAAARAGWQVQGTEVSASAIRQACRQGFTVFQGELAAALYPDDYFDVVAAVEVFEHVPDPAALLQEISRILRPGGLLWMTTPHCGGISWQLLNLQWSVVDPPEHLQLFSIQGLRRLLQHTGFRQQTIFAQGVNPIEIVTALRTRGQRTTRDGVERVEQVYQLNETLTASRSRQMLKHTVNGILSTSRRGDSLKAWAVL